MASNYGSMTISELREELRSRGAKMSGRKIELVERLEAYNRNFNFGKKIQETQVFDFKMATPDESSYKDLHAGISIPSVSMETIQAYLEPLNKMLEKESVNLVKERFLRYIKISMSSGMCFVKSQCWAEMKKSVKYNVDISIDKSGLIDECQCECGAGMGPEAHCKHVNAVLYALFKFDLTKELFTEETCTQKLQTFHRAKKHKGSPIKAKHLMLSKRVGQRSKPVNYDPRKLKYRKRVGYTDYFKNTCINYKDCGLIAFSQMLKSANLYAVVNDHGYYTKETAESLFLKDLRISVISQSEVDDIEKKTRQQATSKQWVEMRGYRLNSSTFGRICKLTDKTDKVKYASSLTSTRAIMCAAVKHGKKYERLAIRMFEEQSGLKVKRCGTFVCDKHPFIASSPDGLVENDSTLEVKCPFAARNKLINIQTVPYLAPHTDGYLTLKQQHDYYYQIQGQMFCTNRQFCFFCVYTCTFKDFYMVKIERDVEFIGEMLTRLKSFFENYMYFRKALLKKFLYRNIDQFNFA